MFSETFTQPVIQHPSYSRAQSLCKVLILALSCSASLLVIDVTAFDDDYENKLIKVKRQIAAVESSINRDKGELATQYKALQKVEKILAELEIERQEIEQKLQASTAKLKSLNTEYNQLQPLKRQQQLQVQENLQSAYQMGKQDQLKILLNQDSPEKIARMLKYYKYIGNARNQKIEEYLNTMQQIKDISEQTRNQQIELKRLQAKLQEQQQTQLKSKAQRHQLVTNLNANISSGAEQLKRLNQQSTQLQQLIDSVLELTEEITSSQNNVDITSVKGKLPQPVSGKILNHYNSKRIGSLRWTGVFVAATEGSAVKAVHYGQVVFSGYFRGLGLLVFIDHGNDYLTLYGHNQTLNVSVGDRVIPNQIIASAGNTGGQDKSGLYFELRYKGQTQNPLSWISW